MSICVYIKIASTASKLLAKLPQIASESNVEQVSLIESKIGDLATLIYYKFA